MNPVKGSPHDGLAMALELECILKQALGMNGELRLLSLTMRANTDGLNSI
ncbi:hypothetical protein F442_16513 [Phytophthora nicotianae P10297]|uniref:Uncharacterized protein n=2 Tax=Phytophthora nicotianae TaxID=4792 RepID=W2PPL5_PHYN3|nr:hypothetical protein PPTG_23868 [Phytophthora nicotianae INRA-310]ETN02933.1 hypothetical protein PPTG_23868 [Phytophthora nicotianae INRA-310]ETP35260.1 hypothetical protein F442_16513 [Phytophthora nicotianae P10297]